MNLLAIVLTLASSFIALSAQGAKPVEDITRLVYCVQKSPLTSSGYIVEEATIKVAAGQASIKMTAFGKGPIKTENPPIAEPIYQGGDFVDADPKLLKKSPPWPRGQGFVIPIKKSLGQLIFYVHPKALVENTAAPFFDARIKLTVGKKVSNYDLRCNPL